MTVTAAHDADATDDTVTLSHRASGGGYSSVSAATVAVTVNDDDSAAPSGPVIVKLVQVPDGTFIPNNRFAENGPGVTVQDGLRFVEGELVYYRLLIEAVGGGPPTGDGVEVQMSFSWDFGSPLAANREAGRAGGMAGRILPESKGLSLHRTSMWDTTVLAFDDEIGSPDATLTIEITNCSRNGGCVIGSPSQLTVTIVDNDGGPAASPPGKPDPPRLVCSATDDGYDPTGVAVSWKAPSLLGGAAIEDYNLSYRRRISGAYPWVWDDWQFWPHTGTATSATITGLDPDSLYEVIVQAVNTGGEGPWSELGHTFWTGYDVNTCEIIDRNTPHP